MLPAQPNQALIDGLAVLQELAADGGPIGSREMGRRLGIEATRANRLLRTLAHLGMAAQTRERKYIPGPAMHVLSAQSLFASGLIRAALEPLADLARYHMTVALGVLWRDSVCYLYHAQPGMDQAEALGRVGLYPAARSGIGLALLAQQPAEIVASHYGDAPDGFESLESLLKELERVRARGWAYALVSPEPLVATVAVPVGSPAYASIALSGPIKETSSLSYVEALRKAAAAIEVKPAKKEGTLHD